LHHLNDVLTFFNTAKNDVFTVKPRRLLESDEKLGTVGVLASIRARE